MGCEVSDVERNEQLVWPWFHQPRSHKGLHLRNGLSAPLESRECDVQRCVRALPTEGLNSGCALLFRLGALLSLVTLNPPPQPTHPA